MLFHFWEEAQNTDIQLPLLHLSMAGTPRPRNRLSQQALTQPNPGPPTDSQPWNPRGRGLGDILPEFLSLFSQRAHAEGCGGGQPRPESMTERQAKETTLRFYQKAREEGDTQRERTCSLRGRIRSPNATMLSSPMTTYGSPQWAGTDTGPSQAAWQWGPWSPGFITWPCHSLAAWHMPRTLHHLSEEHC